ncbi:MAG TPA: diaminopimelate epimerase [Polyangiaceae bacterium]|nr:diaminopimelate epimerase [Polyangiaceae bacterium]
MSAGLQFRKYEGLGNDFVVVDALDERAVAVEQAPGLCDRRRGIGADGVLLVLPPRRGDCDVRMRVLNADGSVPEMCGNGARCVALHVARARGLRRATLKLDTDAGVRSCEVDDAVSFDPPGRAGTAFVTIDMGVIAVLGERSLEVGGERLTVTLADAGNPHAVVFGDFARADVERIGPRVATSVEFPSGTNVEFARADGGGIELMVWERGVGMTLACGTGACATAAVACARGIASLDRVIGMTLPGGRLEVTIGRDHRATMRGPARHVFSGVLAPGWSGRP